MTDREMLELAAKAAGYVVRWYDDSMAYGPTFGIEVEPGNPCGFEPWNPLDDDGDALRLAVDLRLEIELTKRTVLVEFRTLPSAIQLERLGNNPHAATRRSVTRAAAEIGRAMP